MLKNKVAQVTGAGSGTGRAVALVCARGGAKVVVSDHRDVAGGQDTVSQLRALGGEAVFVAADVVDPHDAQALVEHAVAQYGASMWPATTPGSAAPSHRWPTARWTPGRWR